MREASEAKILFDENLSFVPSGNLTNAPLPRILYFLKKGSESGVLSVKRGVTQKFISFENGNPRFVMSNIIKECLGSMLVSKGKITREQCEESLELMKNSKKRQGEILVKMGLLKSSEIDEALKEQARERILELFGWQDGEYIFTPKLSFKKELIPIDIGVSQIVLLGVKRYYEYDFLRKRFVDFLDFAPEFTENGIFNLESFKLAPWEVKAVKVFKGRAALRQIIAAGIARELDLYHLLFAMGSLEVVKFKNPISLEFQPEQSSPGVRLSEIKIPPKKETTKPGTSEVSMEYVYGEKTKERLIKQRKKRLNIAIKLLIPILLVAAFKLFWKGSLRLGEFTDPAVIKSGGMSDGVLTLICNDNWNPTRDPGVTRETLNKMYPKIMRYGHKKVKLTNSSGNLIALAFSGSGEDFLVVVY